MRIKLTVLSLSIMLLVGCGDASQSDLEYKSESITEISQQEEQQNIVDSSEKLGDMILEEKLSDIGFNLTSGQYSRKVIQDEIEYIEMITLSKNSFLRISSNESEKEVYVYNYNSDNFSYLYYYKSKRLSKTTFNIESGEIIENDEGYAELLDIEAKELKQYFFDLLKQADLETEDLKY